MKLRLPHLSPTAKGQLWGMLVSGALCVWVVNRSAELSWGLFFIGWAGAWALGEMLFGRRLIGTSDAKAITLAVVSGLAFPVCGLLFAALFVLIRP